MRIYGRSLMLACDPPNDVASRSPARFVASRRATMIVRASGEGEDGKVDWLALLGGRGFGTGEVSDII